MAVITLDKIIFRNNDSYLKMYKGSELIAEVESTPTLDYLTFTALEAGSTVRFIRNGVYNPEYSTDNGTTWSSADSVVVTLSNIGDRVMYRGITTDPSSSVSTTAFTLTGQIKASGSIMSMINKDPDDTSLHSNNYAFRYYFYKQSSLKDISELILPATLTSGCYYYMFSGCTGITTIPNKFLPATTLASSCYSNMFNGCTGLTTLPENLLPATTLTKYCYANMFQGCTSLTTAPTLPATTLTGYCYIYMFSGCTHLNRIVTYATNISANKCLNYWLSNVASTGDFYNLGGATYSSGASGIPEGWTRHTTPPLPPLTFTALEANSTVKFSREGVTSEYSTDNGSTWASGDNVTVTLSNIGDKVMYRGITSTNNNVVSSSFTLTGQLKASGSVNSMINNNPDDTNLNSKNYAFYYYFYNQTALKDINELRLPATTLTDYCYSGMFYGCTGLTTLPANLLPATSLNTNCYRNMFYNCTGLTTIPKNLLPATSLANYCYNHMFYGCTSLTQAPDLPAEASSNYCYASMFEKCSSLVDGGPKIWLRETSASNCLQLMFSECTKLNRAYIRVQSSDSFSNAAYWLDSVGSYGYIIVPALNSNYKYSGFPSGYNGLPDTWGVSDSKWDN